MVVGQNNANQQEESVYNLIPRTEVRPTKPFRYISINHFSFSYFISLSHSYESKFKPNVRESFKEGKYEHRTMGYADEPIPNPQNFLKKQQNNPKLNASNDSKDTSKSNKDVQKRKPPVPSIRDAPKMGVRTEKNFVKTNALDVVMTVPRKPERNIVDDRFGDKYPIDQSGLTPKYLLKKVFI
jgi:hypothetical protein